MAGHEHLAEDRGTRRLLNHLEAFGRYLFGLCIFVMGSVWVVSGDFVSIWQPMPENLPSSELFAVPAGLLFLSAGAALMFKRTARLGAIAVIPVLMLFVAKWIARILLLPTVAGTWSGCGEELVPVLAAVLILAADRSTMIARRAVSATCRMLFGLCAIAFGWVHFEALQQTAGMVPEWIPGTGQFWAKATGVGHAVGGLALMLNLWPRLAARLLAAMFLVFELTIWLPRLLANAADPVVWTGNAMTAICAASALILAAAVGRTATVSVHDSELVRTRLRRPF